MEVYEHVLKSLVIYLRFHQNENLPKFSRRRRLDDVLTTSHMRRTLARENFTSARRRRAISLSMLKVPNVYKLTTIFVCVHQRVREGGRECNQHILHRTGYIEIYKLHIVG